MLSAALSTSGCLADPSAVAQEEALISDSQSPSKAPALGAPHDLITVNHKAAAYDDGFGQKPGDLITVNHKAAAYDDGFSEPAAAEEKANSDQTEKTEKVEPTDTLVSDPKAI